MTQILILRCRLPQISDFLQRTFFRGFSKRGRMLWHKSNIKYVLACKRLSNDGVGVARGIVFQEIWPAGSWFQKPVTSF